MVRYAGQMSSGSHYETGAPLVAGWRELCLLVLLAAIWSSSFTFIKIGVETIRCLITILSIFCHKLQDNIGNGSWQ